ncbi:hypothetical protein D3C83_222810 [compost metagenome]
MSDLRFTGAHSGLSLLDPGYLLLNLPLRQLQGLQGLLALLPQTVGTLPPHLHLVHCLSHFGQ